jgi:hypothetical protein
MRTIRGSDRTGLPRGDHGEEHARVSRAWGMVIFAVAMALSSSCTDASVDDSSVDVGLEQQQQAFKLGSGSAFTRIANFTSGHQLKIYLYGGDVTASNRASKEALIRSAAMKWVDAVRPVAKTALIESSDIVFTSTSYDLDLNWQGYPGRAEANGVIGWMVLYQGDGLTTALHEFGHVFGIEDTYIEGGPGCQSGEPHSVMCDCNYTDLQPDDITAIRESFRTKYPDLIDLDSTLVWNYSQPNLI